MYISLEQLEALKTLRILCQTVALATDFVIENPNALIQVKSNALIKRASLNVQNEQHQKGFEDFATAVNLDPTNADVYHQRGQVYILLEKLNEALEDFNLAIQLAPEMCSAIVQKCYADYRNACLNQNQVQIYNAIQNTHRATEKFPNNIECYNILAQILSEQQQYDKADELFERAITNNIECYNILAQILSEQQQYDKADELFERAITLQPTQASYVHQGLLHLQWNGDVTKALALLHKAIEVDEKCKLAYETLGTIQVQRGLLENAIQLFEKALTLCRSELEMVHIYSLRNAAMAQLNVAKKLGLDLSSLSALGGAGVALV